MKIEDIKVFPDSVWEKMAGRKLSAFELYEMNAKALELKEFLEQEQLTQKRAALQKEVEKLDQELTEAKRNAVFIK